MTLEVSTVLEHVLFTSLMYEARTDNALYDGPEVLTYTTVLVSVTVMLALVGVMVELAAMMTLFLWNEVTVGAC